MAVAFNAAAVGSAETQIRLRNEITVQLTAPQAVAPGDEFELTAHVFNHELPAGDARVTLAVTGPIKLSGDAAATVPLDKGGEASARFRLRAAPDAAGAGTIRAVLEMGGARHEAVAHLASRPPSPPLYLSGYAQVPAGGSLDLTLPGDWFAGTGKTRLEVSTVMAVEASGAFRWLRQYPYGCLEQSVSAAFPLLYFPELLPAPRPNFTVPLLYLPAALAAWTSAWTVQAPGDTSPFVPELRSAVQRVAMMEVAAGGFAMWPGSSRVWNAGTVYTAHFLAEIRNNGGEVDPALWSRTLEFLRQAVSRGRGELTPGEKAYALYVLACAGKPEHGLAESVAADSGAEPFSRFLAAAALVRGGRARVGAERLTSVFKDDYVAGGIDSGSGSGLDSRTRRIGLALSILSDVMPDSPECVRLVEALRKSRNPEGHWGSTQDNAFAVLGLGKWARLHPGDAATRGLVLPPGDAPQVEVSKEAPTILTDLSGRGNVTVKSLGPGPVYCAWTSAGVPLKPLIGKSARGISVTRVYLTEDGKTAPAFFKQGDLVRVRITIESAERRQNVAVADLLPGGFEIEDETLASRWAPAAQASDLRVQFLDKREDRLLLFVDLQGGAPATFTYAVRAVSRGTFAVPAISAEAMYEPAVRGSFAPGEKIEIR